MPEKSTKSFPVPSSADSDNDGLITLLDDLFMSTVEQMSHRLPRQVALSRKLELIQPIALLVTNSWFQMLV